MSLSCHLFVKSCHFHVGGRYFKLVQDFGSEEANAQASNNDMSQNSHIDFPLSTQDSTEG